MAETDGHHVSPSKVLTILGCGTLGSAILYGLLASAAEEKTQNDSKNGLANGHGPPTPEDEEKVDKPTHFIACVRTAKSATRLKTELAAQFPYPVPVKISQGDNIHAVQAASNIILGCQPQDLENCLSEPGLTRTLHDKLIISILAGVTILQIEDLLHPPSNNIHSKNGISASPTTTIIRAMPNTSSLIRHSTTLLTYHPATPPPHLHLTHSIFCTIGTCTPIPPALFDACTALCGSTPAFFALFIDGLLDGAVALGLKRSEAKRMAAETMRGAAEGLLRGEGVEGVREKVATPGGSTIQGLLVLEREGVRGLIADALAMAAGAAGGLGRK